jgi:peroxiredoxin
MKRSTTWLSATLGASLLTGAVLAQDGPTQEPPPAAVVAPGTATIGQPAPDFTLRSVQGAEHSLAALRGKVVVLEWIAPDCAMCAKYHSQAKHPVVPDLVKEYAGEDVAFLAIASGKAAEPDQLRELLADWGLTRVPVLLDPDTNVARAYGARATPHAFVIDEGGVLRYSGAIDDDTSIDDVGGQEYLADAIEAVSKGEAPSPAQTVPHGGPIAEPRDGRGTGRELPPTH